MIPAAIAHSVSAETSDDGLWYKDAVIYQLHVKSFFDSNDDGVGDFRGLIAKLDYIVTLGANTIWLLPFYPSPRKDDGYDIAEYEAVHADYGTLDDARDFIEAAHARGLRVVTELVINHTSDQHVWFQRARRAPLGSPERDFYVWADDDRGYAGTRVIFCDTEKSNWTFDAVAGQYYWHRFYSHQPDLNFDNPAVLDAVIAVMHFWLRLGVDGLRLDAVPYLIEREGTSNENLPETHAILKRIRAEVDAHFPGRMLLAEANMWPEDTQQYFGNVRDGAGDECHMAFHFPLMPRMYMAIAREDRFPITDIVRQTPAIPDNCQWAIFLRNHDELTLEMVTDAERDYLWQTYAEDRRARINLGIRRRLAPLMQRDRRRIELMMALLLTMPGTPVLYYGDELGMGDNIHLGDRDGVRTPMQWSMDRNGGFSRADPAAIVLPPVMDPLYGYAALNVEAQERDQYSLLNWTRRVLAVRARHRAFGRGTLEFLYPRNRKVMAYLREWKGDTLLCVANLSRSLQAVELDLGAYRTRVPVDVIGGCAFPPVGELPYLLTLPAYGFYVFQLAADAALPAWHVAPPEPMPEYRTLVLRGTDALAEALEGYRGVLESEILPAYLVRRRWFAEKDRSVRGIRMQLQGRLDSLQSVEFVLLDITFDHGEPALYQLPLAIAWEGDELGALPQQLALARVRQGRRVGYLTDAFSMPEFARGVVASSGANPSEDTSKIQVSGNAGLLVAEDAGMTWLSGEQSNSSLVVGDAVMLKLLRRVRAGVQPEVEFAHELRDAVNVPALVGDVTATDSTGQPMTLILMQRFVRNQGDGWQWSVDYLERAVQDWQVADDAARRDELAAGYATLASRVGRRLGQLHAFLAESKSRAFAPQPLDADRARVLLERVEGELRMTRDALASIDAHCALPATSETETMAAIEAGLAAASKGLVGSLETRIHGDFHLGQVLVSADDVYIVDFEGEPALPLAERRRLASPFQDVAGLLRSLHYAEQSVRLAHLEDAVNVGVDECLATLRAKAEAAFLAAYANELANAPVPWADAAQLTKAMPFFLIAKAAYEVRYELANRPAWLPIAVAGLAHMAARA